jgi:hypothetical protein
MRVDAHQALDLDRQAGLFLHLAPNRVQDLLPQIHETAGEGPETVVLAADQQQAAAIVEERAVHGDLGRDKRSQA